MDKNNSHSTGLVGSVEQCNGTVQSEVGKVINFIDEHGLHIYSTCPRGSL
jgi:hypothetical protein